MSLDTLRSVSSELAHKIVELGRLPRKVGTVHISGRSVEPARLVEAIEQEGLRGEVKIMIGGAPVTQKFSDEIGADFYAADSTSGRNYARDVMSGEG